MSFTKSTSVMQLQAELKKRGFDPNEFFDKQEMLDKLNGVAVAVVAASSEQQEPEQTAPAAAGGTMSKASQQQQRQPQQEAQQSQQQAQSTPAIVSMDPKKWHVSTPEERRETQKLRDEQLALWRAHPMWKASGAAHFVEEVHEHFRVAFSSMAHDIERYKNRPVDVKLFAFRMKELESHHQSEDSSLFPGLKRRFPSIAPALKYLEKDHKQLEPLSSKVIDEKDGEAAVEFSAFLHDHLCREEMLVIPLWLSSAP